jgi:gluconate kinase
MPTSLLASQLATLEPLEADEDGAVIEIAGTPDEIVTSAIRALGLREVGAATPPTR